MRVLVTGATGFVGSHAAAALVRAGHRVQVLARDPARVPTALGPHGISVEVAAGDMTDPAAVAAAVSGCDAVIHAAAQIGVGGSGGAGEANLDGVRTVVGAALDAGVARVVYTSSVTVHVPTTDVTVTLDSPLAAPLSPYGATKVAAEEAVRAWQDDGHPITTVVLGGVYGPQAPALISSFTAVLAAIETMMLVPPGGTSVVDVRDVATLLSRVVETDDPGTRVLAGGHFLGWDRWVEVLGTALGRPILSQVVTVDELFDLARQFEAAAPPGEPPALSVEAAQVMTSMVPTDDASSLARFGMALTPVEQTFADVIAYLRAIGRLPEGA